jgi:hypothetical protein
MHMERHERGIHAFTGQGVQDFFVATPGVAPVAGTSAPTETAPATPSGGGYGY